MLFSKHNFKNNYLSALGANDISITADILYDSLSEILLSKPDTVVDLLNKCRVSTSKKESLEEIVEKLLKNMPNNSTLVRGVAFLVAEHEGLIDEAKSKADAFDMVNKLAMGIRRIVNKTKSSEQEYYAAKDNIMGLLKIKVKTMNKKVAKKITTDKKFWKPILIFSAIVIVIIILAANWNKWFGKKKKEEGGSVEGAEGAEGAQVADDDDPLKQPVKDADYASQAVPVAGEGGSGSTTVVVQQPVASGSKTDSGKATSAMQKMYEKSKINQNHKKGAGK